MQTKSSEMMFPSRQVKVLSLSSFGDVRGTLVVINVVAVVVVAVAVVAVVVVAVVVVQLMVQRPLLTQKMILLKK